jgi:hypothetical protein
MYENDALPVVGDGLPLEYKRKYGVAREWLNPNVIVEVLDIPPRLIGENEPETTSTAKLIRVDSDDPTPEQRMRIVEASGVLDFWKRPEEDIYDA